MATTLLRVECHSQAGSELVDEWRYIYSDSTKEVSITKLLGMAKCSPRTPVAAGSIVDDYCDGTTRVIVKHDGYGAVYEERETNSSACNSNPYVSITSLELTHESERGANDGQVRIYTTTNTGEQILFSLNPDSGFQGSSIIKNLAPGEYTAYALTKDSRLKDSEPFTILPGASGAAKYQIDYTDQRGRDTSIKIFDRDWSGETTLLCGTGEPLIIDYKGKGDELYASVKAQEAQVNILAESDFNFTEFFQADEQQYRVEIFKGEQLIFIGFILPDVWQEPYLYPPFEVNISATDGLGVLNNYRLELQGGGDFTERTSVLEYISTILNKVNLSLPIVSHVNLFHELMTKTSEPLSQALINPDVFLNEEGEFMNCREALEHILKAFNARIYQEQGKWHIMPITQAGRPHTAWEFDGNGNFVSSYDFGSVTEIAGPSVGEPYWIEASQLLQFRPAMKSVKTTYRTRGKYNFLPYGFFEEESWDESGKLRGWKGDAPYVRDSSSFDAFGLRDIQDDLVLIGAVNSLADAKSISSIPFVLDRGMHVDMHVKVDTDNAKDYPAKTNPQLFISVQCGEYYWKWNTNEWTTEETYNNVIPTDNELKLNEYRFSDVTLIGASPNGEKAVLTIYQGVQGGYSVDSFRISHIALYEDVTTHNPEEISYTRRNDRPFSSRNENEIIIGGDYMRPGASDVLMTGTMWVGNKHAGEWGGIIKKPFHEWNTLDRYANYEQAKQLLTGSLFGQLLFSDILHDPLNSGHFFLCTGMTYRDKACIYEGEWHEIISNYELPKDYLIDYETNYARDYNNYRVLDY
jgi:hypothetical protein